MANGIIYGSTNNQYVKCKIVWSSSPDVASNTSSVTAKLYYWRTNTGYTTSGPDSYQIKIGVQTSDVYSPGIVLTNSTPVLAMTYTRTGVPHNADGSLSVLISAFGGKKSGSFTSTTCSGTAVLDTIPRATKPVVSTPNLKLGQSLSFTVTPAVSSFRHDIQIMFAGEYTWYGSKLAGGTYSYLLPEDFAQRIPNALSASGSVRCWTYSGDTQIGYAEASFTAAVSDDTVPRVSLTVSEAVLNIAAQFGAYIKTKSKWNLTASGSGIYGSTIKSYKVNANGMTYNSASASTDYLTKAGTNQLTATVTDSRGRSKTAAVSVNVLDYANPEISSFSVVRTNQDGTYNEEGTYVKVSFSWNISSCNNKNTKSAQLKYKKHSETAYQTQTVSLGEYSGSTSVQLSGIDIDSTYDVILSISDYFTTVERDGSIPTAYTLVDYRAGGKGIAFGKVAEKENAVEVDMDLYANQTIYGKGNLFLNYDNPDTAQHSIRFFNASSGSASTMIYGGDSASPVILGVRDNTNAKEIWDYRTDGNLRFSVPIMESGEGLLHKPKTLWSGSITTGQTATMSEPLTNFSFAVLIFDFVNNGKASFLVRPSTGVSGSLLLNGTDWNYYGNPANVSGCYIALTGTSTTLTVKDSQTRAYYLNLVYGLR